MNEEKKIKINFSTFLLVLVIILIFIISYFTYKFYNERNNEKQNVLELENQVAKLENDIDNLQKKIDSISKITNNETITKENNSLNMTTEDITNENTIDNNNQTSVNNNLSEKIILNGKYINDSELETYIYNFTGNEVIAESLSSAYGTYTVENNVIQIIYTRAEDPDGNELSEFPDGKTARLMIVDENTLIDDNGNKYIKK